MNEISGFTSYGEYKRILDNELQKTAEGFVKIGFLLKKARDTDILKESGYKNYIEFAQAEYSIDKTTVSRFIRINDKFSEEGNSEMLKEQYRGFGYAKLAIMLQLPEEVNQILTPNFSKTEIQAIKDEVDEEAKTSDLEMIIEREPDLTKGSNTLLEKAVRKLLYDKPDSYVYLFKTFKGQQEEDVRKIRIAETFAPSETKVEMIRIPGIGRLAVSFKGLDKEIEIVNIRSGEKESFSWDNILEEITRIMPDEEEEKTAWTTIYQKPFPEPVKEPEKTEVAPVQLQKSEIKKQSKVTKAKVEQQKQEVEEPVMLHDIMPEIPKPKPQADIEESQCREVTDEGQQDTQVPGQDTVENHKDWMPEEKVPDVIDGKFEITGIGEQEITSEAHSTMLYNKLKQEIWKKTETIRKYVDCESWEQAIIRTAELLEKLKTVKELGKPENE